MLKQAASHIREADFQLQSCFVLNLAGGHNLCDSGIDVI